MMMCYPVLSQVSYVMQVMRCSEVQMFSRQMILTIYTTVTHVNRCTEIPPLTKHTLLTNHTNVMCVIGHIVITLDLTVTKKSSTMA